MNNLTTRKIVLGMLMTLVLAFSVQGIADAYELTRSTNSIALLPIPSSGDNIRTDLQFWYQVTTQTEVDAETCYGTRKSKYQCPAVTSFTVSGLSP